MVRFENVGLRYGLGPEVLRDLSFAVEPHSFQFLTGPSAANGALCPPHPCPARAEACYNPHMTKLLEQGIEAVRELAPERQDMAGELLLTLAGTEPQYRLTRQQIEDLKLAIEEADRGEFVSAVKLAETWRKFGL